MLPADWTITVALENTEQLLFKKLKQVKDLTLKYLMDTNAYL